MADNNIVKLLRCFVEPIQELEDEAQKVLLQRTLDNAVGFLLDGIGKLVGQQRLGLDDETYRRYIRARIVANNSDGMMEDLIAIADLIVFDDDATYVVENQGAACCVLRVEGIALPNPLADILIAFLRSAAVAGVRVILESSTAAPIDWFVRDTDPHDTKAKITARDRVLGVP